MTPTPASTKPQPTSGSLTAFDTFLISAVVAVPALIAAGASGLFG